MPQQGAQGTPGQHGGGSTAGRRESAASTPRSQVRQRPVEVEEEDGDDDCLIVAVRKSPLDKPPATGRRLSLNPAASAASTPNAKPTPAARRLSLGAAAASTGTGARRSTGESPAKKASADVVVIESSDDDIEVLDARPGMPTPSRPPVVERAVSAADDITVLDARPGMPTPSRLPIAERAVAAAGRMTAAGPAQADVMEVDSTAVLDLEEGALGVGCVACSQGSVLCPCFALYFSPCLMSLLYLRVHCERFCFCAWLEH